MKCLRKYAQNHFTYQKKADDSKFKTPPV